MPRSVPWDTGKPRTRPSSLVYLLIFHLKVHIKWFLTVSCCSRLCRGVECTLERQTPLLLSLLYQSKGKQVSSGTVRPPGITRSWLVWTGGWREALVWERTSVTTGMKTNFWSWWGQEGGNSWGSWIPDFKRCHWIIPSLFRKCLAWDDIVGRNISTFPLILTKKKLENSGNLWNFFWIFSSV